MFMDIFSKVIEKKVTWTQIVPVLMWIGIVITGCTSEQQATPVFETAGTATLEIEEVETETIIPEVTEDPVIEVETPIEEITSQDDVYANVDPSGQVITFWHPFTGDREDILLEIVDDFNVANQWGLLVEASYQGDYTLSKTRCLRL